MKNHNCFLSGLTALSDLSAYERDGGQGVRGGGGGW